MCSANCILSVEGVGYVLLMVELEAVVVVVISILVNLLASGNSLLKTQINCIEETNPHMNLA